MERKSIVIVGAGLAGHACAVALRRRDPEAELTIVGSEAQRPYDRPPLSKDFLAGAVGEPDLSLETEGEDLGATWMLGRTAVELRADDDTRTVVLDDGAELVADAVVIATGARARRLPGHYSGVFTVQTIDDSRRLREVLRSRPTLVIGGAGFIGLEVAATAVRYGADVTVVCSQRRPLDRQFGRAASTAIARLHTAAGVRFVTGEHVTGLVSADGGNDVVAAVLDSGRLLPADAVVLGIGSDPNIEWLRGSALALTDGVLCDPEGRTSLAGVYAVGDCAAWPDPSGAQVRCGHWTEALREANVVAAQLCGARDVSAATGYVWSDQYGVRLQFAGHRRGDEQQRVEYGGADGTELFIDYERDGESVAAFALGMSRRFNAWRRERRRAGRPTLASAS